MKISNFQSLGNITELPDLIRAADMDMNLIIAVLNGGVDLVTNCDLKVVTVNFLAANREYPFTHSLSRVPAGFLNAGLNVNATIFNGTTKNNTSQIFLQASAICNGKILVF